MTELPALGSVLVVGTGLMGTSVALALRGHGVEVHLTDRDPAVAEMAAAFGAGTVAGPDTPPADLAVIGAPPAAVPAVLADLQRRGAAAAYTDLASTKSGLQRALEGAGADATTFVGGHPLAGSERSGPTAARGDLFEGRPWVLTPSADSAPDAVAAVRELIRLCRANAVVMDPEEHDRAVALVSHAPQVLASLVGARLVDAPEDAVQLAGQGVRDVTRIAASDPALWTEILGGNATAVADVLDGVARDLEAVRQALRAGDISPVTAALQAGNAGRARLPGKHGGEPAKYTWVPVLVPDRPRELARLMTDVGDADFNIEDLEIEHSPGQPVGLARIAVRPDRAEPLVAELRSRGWTVHW
ncbi:prephenate dehydrogenase [Sporichthya brevicatena]|uniref:Prephenate dehydrogenase n=1 Tax=Sporichthya brevicatena TaxID=171442 RepID=A0ABN1H256_9ACTN